MRFRAAEQVRLSLEQSHAAVALDLIEANTAGNYAHWLEGSDASDPFCATAKSASTTAQGKDASPVPAPMFVAVISPFGWTPPEFFFVEVLTRDVVPAGRFLEAPLSPPPQA